MVTYNALEQTPQIENEDHQHAFVLVGQQQLFGVHMTQYHCELHKYQIILKLKLPDDVYAEYMALRQQHPDDSFVLCNANNEGASRVGEVREFCVPDLGCGRVTEFTANIFQGIRPLSPIEIESDTHFFPWAKKYVKPAIGEFTATVERIVTFRPFDHLHELPVYATYLLWGDGNSQEAHMTNLQTAGMATDGFEPGVFGPDYDHVMSLETCPDWLQQDALLEAGIVVTVPDVQLIDLDTGMPTIPATAPFAKGETIDVMYRGIGPARTVQAAASFLYATAVCNSPRFFAPRPEHNSYLKHLPEVPEVLEFSMMPKRYWAFGSE